MCSDSRHRTVERVKRLIGVIVVVLGLLGLALGAEVWTRAQIASRVAQPLEEHLGVDASVSVHGPLVLPQVVGGELERVDVTAPRVSYRGFTVVEVEGSANGVQTADPHRADRLWVSARVPTVELDRMYREVSPIGGTITTDGGTVNLQGELFGQVLGIAFGVEARDRAIVLEPREVYLGQERVDVSLLGLLLSGVDQEVEIGVDLPRGLRLTGAEVRSNGLEIVVQGTDLELAALAP